MVIIFLYLAVLLCAIPTGFVLAHAARDEVKKWRSRLYGIAITSVISSGALFLIPLSTKLPMQLTLLFIAITCLTLILRSR